MSRPDDDTATPDVHTLLMRAHSLVNAVVRYWPDSAPSEVPGWVRRYPEDLVAALAAGSGSTGVPGPDGALLGTYDEALTDIKRLAQDGAEYPSQERANSLLAAIYDLIDNLPAMPAVTAGGPPTAAQDCEMCRCSVAQCRAVGLHDGESLRCCDGCTHDLSEITP